MRTGLLLLPLLLIGCDRTANTFEVQAPGAASAELRLCGRTTSLQPSGGKLAASRAITCEGEGDITVRFPKRPPVGCHVGYVTPGAAQDFRFKVDGDRCRPSNV